MASHETDRLLSKMPGERGTERSKGDDRMRLVQGLMYLLSVVLLWTISNFITSALETGEDSWNKPFLITYLNTASFVFYLIPSYYKYRKPRSKGYSPVGDSEPSTSLARDGRDSGLASDTVEPSRLSVAGRLPDLTVRETAQVAAWWSAVWFLGNWSITAALSWTSVASATVLASTSGFFTLALGRVFKVETFTQLKIFAAVASFLGVVLTTHSDQTLSTTAEGPYPTLPSHPILGDVISLFSAACYAAYVVLLKVQLGDEDRADPQLLLGFAGLYNVVFLIPVFPLLHYSGIETFELPPTRAAWVICGINMCITLVSDYLYVLAVLRTSPMLVTVGLSLTIPCALVGTLFVPSATIGAITIASVAGAAMVCAGFGLLSMEEWKQSLEGVDLGSTRSPSLEGLDGTSSAR